MSAVYQVRFLPEPPPLDGVGREGGWGRLPVIGPLTLHDGGPAQFETTVRAGFDETHLFVSFQCLDDDVWGTFTDRNDPIYNEEVVEVFLDPKGDGLRYFEFEVSPRNVVLDGVNRWVGGELNWDPSWSCVDFATAVAVNGSTADTEQADEGWSATLAIPFKCLGVTPQPGDRWRGNFYRIDRSRRGPAEEYQAWRATQEPGEEPMFNVPSRFGTLEFTG